MIKQREIRIRRLVKTLNYSRKKQAGKIDILCNDMVNIHREFIKTIDTLAFAAEFYKSIIAARDLSALLAQVHQQLKPNLTNSALTFFVKRAASFEVYSFGQNSPNQAESIDITDLFTDDLLEKLTESVETCSLNELLEWGLPIKPTHAARLFINATPITRFGKGIALIVNHGPAKTNPAQKLTPMITAINEGLYKAIDSLSHCPAAT